LPFSVNKIINVEELGGGNTSYVYRVKIRSGSKIESIILKQAHRKIKRKASQVNLPLSRIITEARVINYISQLVSLKVLPKIYFIDHQNYVLIMSDVGQGKKLLSDEIKRNKFYIFLADDFGKFFGQLHSRSYGEKKRFYHHFKKRHA